MVKNSQSRSAGRLALLVYDQLHVFEYGIAVELFCLDRPGLGFRWYDVEQVAVGNGAVRGSGGLRVAATSDLRRLRRANTIVIPGWRNRDVEPPANVVQELVRAHRRGAQLFSICSGAYLLAYAGLLDGRRATTHWLYTEDFRKRFPKVELCESALYVDEGKVITSAGSAAGIDAGLHLIRREFGARVAGLIARRMVTPPHRDGSQQQYVEAPIPPSDHRTIAHAISWAQGRLHQPLSIRAWATSAAMSERSFHRNFVAAVGATPHAWLTHARLDRARRLLESERFTIDEVAERAGYASTETFRSVFRRRVGTSPAAYRARFGAKLRA